MELGDFFEPIPEKIISLLTSPDIENAQVGADLLSSSIRRELWELYLDLTLSKYLSYSIDEDKITITEKYRGLWELLDRKYTLYTGTTGMKLFNEALSNYGKDKTDAGEQ